MVRLQKFLAEAGVASRRAGEKIILEGRVAVNGSVVRELGTKVDAGHDRVTVDGQAVGPNGSFTWRSTSRAGWSARGRMSMDGPPFMNCCPKEWGHLHSVGRLDYNSEGLIFLTNDGEFSLRLTHPRYGVRKKYVATVEGPVDGRDAGASSPPASGTRAKNCKAERARLLSASQVAERGGIGTWPKANTARCAGCLNRKGAR